MEDWILQDREATQSYELNCEGCTFCHEGLNRAGGDATVKEKTSRCNARQCCRAAEDVVGHCAEGGTNVLVELLESIHQGGRSKPSQ